MRQFTLFNRWRTQKSIWKLYNQKDIILLIICTQQNNHMPIKDNYTKYLKKPFVMISLFIWLPITSKRFLKMISTCFIALKWFSVQATISQLYKCKFWNETAEEMTLLVTALLSVAPQGTGLRKRFVANFTLKWFFSCVCPHMILQHLKLKSYYIKK